MYLNLSLGFTTNFDANQNYNEHQMKYSMENMRSMIVILNKYDCIGDSKCVFTFPLRANFVCKYYPQYFSQHNKKSLLQIWKRSSDKGGNPRSI